MVQKVHLIRNIDSRLNRPHSIFGYDVTATGWMVPKTTQFLKEVTTVDESIRNADINKTCDGTESEYGVKLLVLIILTIDKK